MDILMGLTPRYRGPRGIPEVVLQRWSGKGADATAKRTHESVRGVISRLRFPTNLRPLVYLQGSYKNGTNIRADSDVDIVIEFPYQLNLYGTSQDELNDWFTLYSYIFEALKQNYGAGSVSVERKCLRIDGGTSRLSADIVVAFRHLQSYQSLLRLNQASGIRFFVPTESRWVMNFPRDHFQNGVSKNSPEQTNGWYKPTVRIFKNAIGAAEMEVPPYFVECLLYNAPNSLYGLNCRSSFDSVLNWLRRTDLRSFVCQNRLSYLFGATPEQWNLSDAYGFLNRLATFRDNY